MNQLTLISVACIAVILLIASILYWTTTFAKLRHDIELKELETFNLSFDEVNDTIETIVSEVFNNKYLINYKLRDIRILKDMQEEVTKITLDVMSAFDQKFLTQAHRFYTKEYLVQMVTRRVTMLIILYTKEYKPKTR